MLIAASATTVGGTGCATLDLAPQVEPETLDKPTVTMRPNGLRVVIGHDARNPLSAVSVVVGTGSAHDPAERPGLARLVARLALRAHTREGRPRDLVLQSLGASDQYGVRLDDTSYQVLARRELWTDLLAAQLDLLADPLASIDENDLRTELALMRGETDDPGGSRRAIDLLLEAVFQPGDPYATAGRAAPALLDGVTLTELRAFTARLYLPSNATLYVDGDLPADAEAKVVAAIRARGLDAVSRRARPGSPPPYEVAEGGLVVRRRTAQLDRPELWLGWALPSSYGSDAGAVALAVGSAEHILHNDRLRSDDAEIVSIDYFSVKGARATILACRIVLTDKGDPDRAAKAVASSISELWAVLASVSSKDMRAANAHIFALHEETLRDRAAAWPVNAHYTRDPRFTLHAVRSTIEGVDARAAFDFVAKHLTADRARGVFIQPAKIVPPPTVTPASSADPADRTWPAPPDHVPPAPPGGPARTNIVTRVLANGLTAIVAANSGFPRATVVLGFHGGSANDTPAGAAQIVGATGLSVSGYACTTDPSCTTVLGWDVTAAKHLAERSQVPSLLEFFGLSQTFTWVQWPDDHRAGRLREELRAWEASPAGPSSAALREALYPGARWGMSPRLSGLDSITSDAAKKWSDRHRAARNAVVIVVGNVPEDLVLKEIEEELGSWSPGEETAASPPPARPPRQSGPQVLVARTPGARTSEIHFGCRLPPVHERDAIWRDVLAQSLDRTLDRRLRRRLGLVDELNVEHSAYRGGTSELTGALRVANASLQGALDELQVSFARLGEGRWTGDDTDDDDAKARLDLELRAYTTRWIRRGASSDALASHLLERWNLQWPLDDRRALTEAVAHPNAERLAALARECHQTAVISIAADPAVPVSASPRAQAGREASQRMASSSAQ